MTKQFFFNFSPILKFKVLEESMVPSLYPGDFVLVEKITYLMRSPRVGDIVVLRILPRGWDKGGWDKNKLLIKKTQEVHGREYFVIGENQKESIDSRNFGLISKKDIIGRVFHKL